jgi:RNA polymerase sigma-70 factor (sigma-E family)
MSTREARMSRESEFSEYVRSRRPRLLATAYLLCGDRHGAEDLVQTALAKLFVAWPRIHRRGTEDAYVRRILVNAGIDAHRRPWRREEPVDVVPDSHAADSFPPEERDELIAALASLSARQRRIVVLRYWLGLTSEEVAADLQITAGAVRNQAAKGLANLRNQLNQPEEQTGGLR